MLPVSSSSRNAGERSNGDPPAREPELGVGGEGNRDNGERA
jgi:hypothetical protein